MTTIVYAGDRIDAPAVDALEIVVTSAPPGVVHVRAFLALWPVDDVGPRPQDDVRSLSPEDGVPDRPCACCGSWTGPATAPRSRPWSSARSCGG